MKIDHNSEIISIRSRLPVIPLRDVVVFPHMIYPLLIGRNFTISALQEAMTKDKQILLVAQREASVDKPEPEDLYDVGVVARVLQVMKMPNGTFKVLVEGLIRAEVKTMSKTGGYFLANCHVEPQEDDSSDRELEALSRAVMDQFTDYVKLNRRVPDEVVVSLASIKGYRQKADTIAAHILHKIETKQRVLEATEINDQLLILSEILKEENEILKIEQKIDVTVRESMSKSQREFYLQQQLKAIKDELGQFDEPSAEVDDLYAKLESYDYPAAVKTKAEEEIKKLSKMHPYSAESGVVRSYLEWLLSIPWNRQTKEESNFKKVKAILDGDHYGLEKAKSRILEHLAVIRLAGKVKGPILCLVGPPGVGKTSIGRSIARSMSRKFVRVSLGGVHDEAEIRGHRRTYIGAMPGRIIQSMKKAGSSNPVFLLDEVDKIGKDFRGDPASALLEVLDPEQNNTFTDNYLEVEYDLSETLFITTANSIATVPPALRDRMEIIRLPGYLDFEKAAIAKDFLLPKLTRELGLKKVVVEFKDDALLEVVRRHTREAGVRELERQMSAILRKLAVDMASGKRVTRLTVTRAKVSKLLGAPKYTHTNIKTAPTVGYAVGLAWTELGGEVLPVEVAPMKGKAKLTMTGSLGDVMRESATAALSYIRKNAKQFALDENFFENIELHIHIPEGAVPKDGPSAGITLLTALLSSLTSIPVRTDIAMTGEITLIGDVLPVGGLNEKLLAAKRLGITEIIVPEKNRKDIDELQPALLDGLTLHFVRRAKDVLILAMAESPFVKSRSSRHSGSPYTVEYGHSAQ
ncbi:MAG TPA: endopeptidase La [candidate division Zixibacteria bacterium]|nr:endopeptidase La [candidate division Zixibacteria bacterium]